MLQPFCSLDLLRMRYSARHISKMVRYAFAFASVLRKGSSALCLSSDQRAVCKAFMDRATQSNISFPSSVSRL